MIALLWPLLCSGSIGLVDASANFPAETRQAVILSTIRITRNNPDGIGSGVAVSMNDGFCYALTADHVVAKSRKLEVLANVGSEVKKFSQVSVLAHAAEADLALIRFATGSSEIACLSLAEKGRDLKTFPLPVLNAGWQLDDGTTIREDQALDRKFLKIRDRGAFYWQTKGTSEEGRSGGPLISKDGKLIGICSGNQDGKGYYAHRDEIDYFMRKNASSFRVGPQE